MKEILNQTKEMEKEYTTSKMEMFMREST